MALTSKKLAFAKAVLAGKSNKEAALLAGLSPTTAGAAGSRMAKDKDVLTYIAAIRKKAVDGKSKPAKSKPAAKPKTGAKAKAGSAGDDGLPPEDVLERSDDPRAFLLAAMNNPALEPRQRIDAAKALMPFTHKKLGEGGKKDQKDEAAKKAANKFARTPSPLKVVK